MQTTSKFFVSCLFCFALLFVSGCGDKVATSINGNTALMMTAAEQAKFEKNFAECSAAERGFRVELQSLSTEGLKNLIGEMDHMGRMNPSSEQEEFKRNIIRYIVSKGVDVKTKDRDNITMLHCVPDIEIAEFLVSKGADVNAKTADGLTPLIFALYRGKVEIAEFLVSKGADVNAKLDEGRTPLHLAAYSFDIEATRFLVSKRANVNAKNKQGQTPLDGAKERMDYLVKAEIQANDRKKGADVIQYLESVGTKSGK